MSQASTKSTLKWIVIVIVGMTALGWAVVVRLFYPADEYRVARELSMRGFTVHYIWPDGNWIWYRPTSVKGDGRRITSHESQLFCQLPRLYNLIFLSCDASSLNLDEIGNCQKLRFFHCVKVTHFPVNELKKLAACPVVTIHVESKDVDLNDSDLEEFAKFTHLKDISLEFNNIGVTNACLEYFEKIPTLESLWLRGSSITPEGVEEFKKKRPDVYVVEFE